MWGSRSGARDLAWKGSVAGSMAATGCASARNGASLLSDARRCCTHQDVHL